MVLFAKFQPDHLSTLLLLDSVDKGTLNGLAKLILRFLQADSFYNQADGVNI